MEILIKNIRVVNPKTDYDEVSDLFIYEGKVKKIAPAGTLDEEFSGPFARTIDGTGLTAFPGIVDLHVHLRDPGQTEKEDLKSGSLAAAVDEMPTGYHPLFFEYRPHPCPSPAMGGELV